MGALGFGRTKEPRHTFADELTHEAPGIFLFVSILEPWWPSNLQSTDDCESPQRSNSTTASNLCLCKVAETRSITRLF